jgi:isopentenyl phosphate kinase
MKLNDDQQRDLNNLKSELGYAQTIESWLLDRHGAGAFGTPELQEFYDREMAKIRERAQRADAEIARFGDSK